MVDTVFIRYIDNTSDDVEWLILSDNKEIKQPSAINPIDEIKQQLEYHPVVLFVLGSSITLTEVKLPPTSKSKIAQAVPFALEENLAENIEDLHFALGNKTADEKYSVGIVNKHIIENWISPWRNTAFYLQTLLPDFLALPYDKGSWTIVFEGSFARVRTGLLSGFSTEYANCLLFLKIAIASVGLPLEIKIYNYLDKLPIDIEAIKLLGSNVVVEPITLPFIMLCALNYSSALSLDFLQGPYRQKKTLSANKSLWKIVGTLAVITLSFLMVNGLVKLYLLNKQQTLLSQNIETVYKKIFPNATAVVAPEVRVERELNQLQQMQSGGGFLSLLAQSGTIIKSVPHITVKGITFMNNQLTFNIEADSFETLEQLSQALVKQGLIVNQENAASQNNVISARLIIKG